MTPLIKSLRESPEFQAIMAEVLKMRPVVPAYTPQKSRDLTEHLIEEIKHQSSRKQGFDFLYQVLVGVPPQE